MMTKTHFIALADVVRAAKPDVEPVTDLCQFPTTDYERGALAQWEAMRDLVAHFCASQNSRFDRERWFAYIAGECGPNGGKVAIQ